MATRTQTYYHQDEGFDYDKFFFSIFSFTDPIIDGDFLRFTTIFIYEGDEKGPYASYRIRDEFNKSKDFQAGGEFLENYRIDLHDPANSGFSVHQIFNHFENLDADKETEGPLIKQSLAYYFGKSGDEIPNPGEINMSKLPINNNSFRLVENILVKLLLMRFSAENSYYLPLPIIAFGELVGVIYFIYDESNFRTRRRGRGRGEKADFKTNYRSLLLDATREYERIILEGKSKKYQLRPEDILENYRHIFEDLNQPYDFRGKSEKKVIEYKFTYTYQQGAKLKQIISQNPFLLDLGYDDYYSHLARVAIKESRQIIDAKTERIRTAIISIIVDSFAHNIGAHSLVALKWWFEIRYRVASKQFIVKHPLETAFEPELIRTKLLEHLEKTVDFHSYMDDFEHKIHENRISLLNIIRFMDEEIISQIWRFKNPDGMLFAEFPVPVAQSIYHFFQYLRDKSAFWSGVTRETLFSGRMRSWGRILRTFLNNTLFLGTIAHSEGIGRVFLNIEILDEEGNITVGGEYAQVNLEVLEKEKNRNLEKAPSSFNNDTQGYSEYAFLRMGENFAVIQERLEELPLVFLPNGLIGQHALYTLLENTLRNIKHYKQDLPTLRKTGVRLCLSIQEVGLLKRMDDDLDKYRDDYDNIDKYNLTSQKSMYKIGAWLHHPQKLYHGEGAYVNEEKKKFYEKGSIIDAHTQQLRRRVVNENGQAILGGSAQDKVCAAMLMNNSFLSIDRVNLDKVKRQYFPYVYAASEEFGPLEERIRGFQTKDVILHKAYNRRLAGKTSDIRRENYKTFVKEYIEETSLRKARGTIKKFFHIWKGEKCMLVDQDFNFRHENLSRFKVLAIAGYEEDDQSLPFRQEGSLDVRKQSSEYAFRNMGIIRLVEAQDEWEQLDDQALYEAAMITWLRDWFGMEQEKIGIVLFKEGGDYAAPAWSASIHEENGEWGVHCQTETQIESADTYQDLGLEVEDEDIEVNRLLQSTNPVITPILLQHSGTASDKPHVCKLRSHTSFFGDIFEEYDFKTFMKATFPDEQDNPLKLIETTLTHVSIFDDRVYERLERKKDEVGNPLPDPFWDQLRLYSYPEEPELFKEEATRKELLSKKSHFIILHLSFLESIYRRDRPEKNISYKENQVNDFFEVEIESVYKELFGSELPSNIILVITSGRGRGDWFMATEHPQITFRPIESLLGAIEDGLSLKDDFQVKYNLCNVLFGS